MDYRQGKIYKVISPNSDMVYIGSTALTLKVRMSTHHGGYYLWKNGIGGKNRVYELMELGDTEIILVENFPCDTREELRTREGEVMLNTSNCCNKNLPMRYVIPRPAGMTQTEFNKHYQREYQRQYSNENKEKVALRKKNWQDNKYKTNKGIYKCTVCDRCFCSASSEKHHNTTKKHILTVQRMEVYNRTKEQLVV
jgi:hypothetical protein